MKATRLTELKKAEGCKVHGSYLNTFPFFGNVVAMRWNAFGRREFEIKLKEPVEVYGEKRSTIRMVENDNWASTVKHLEVFA